MIAGAGGTNLFASLGIPEILSKIMIDLPLFLQATYCKESLFSKEDVLEIILLTKEG